MSATYNYAAQFELFTKVTVDADKNFAALVTAVIFRLHREPMYEISWFANGDAKTAWIEEIRLGNAE